MSATLQREAAEAMYRALAMMPCRCLHNVPYASGSVEQVIVQHCARCTSMALWEEAIPPAVA
jgi:hypothetical protein